MASRLFLCRALLLVLLLSPSLSAWAHAPKGDARLPVVGPAPEFTLTTQAGSRLSLSELRGKVLAVTFIYATCTDTCPLLTAKMAELQRRLGRDFGPRVRFVSITVDPEVDTPEVLRGYAKAHGANLEGWSFLTGAPAEIKDVVRRYGVYARKAAAGSVDHLFLTSLVDRQGLIRVQYLGYRFAPDEMLADLQALLRE
jgi:protein SCO1/2